MHVCRYTPRLLAYSPDNPLRNAGNAAFVSVVFAKHQPHKYNCWAESQARYVLGSGPRSFMVGYGRKPPTHSLDKVGPANTRVLGCLPAVPCVQVLRMEK